MLYAMVLTVLFTILALNCSSSKMKCFRGRAKCSNLAYWHFLNSAYLKGFSNKSFGLSVPGLME